ncbi:MAG: hypothetical protein AMXMBFR8_24670 [Nevskiales bacterium]
MPGAARLQEESQRYFEHLSDLAGIGTQRYIAGHEADYRGNGVTGDHRLSRQVPGHRDQLSGYAQFFVRFPQGAFQSAHIFGIDPATGKTDLTGMDPELCRTPGQKQHQVRVTLYERHQYSRRNQRL